MSRPGRRVPDQPLYRGDSAAGVLVPEPTAPESIVRHVLFLEGPGRRTPYLSTSEAREAAQHFAGRNGKVWRTAAARARTERVNHISHRELLQLLRGGGRGVGAWPRPYEVLRARQLVEQWAEHLLDFREHRVLSAGELQALVQRLFAEGSP